MKTLSHVRIDGVKNLTGIDLDIRRCIALSGQNGVGKTAITSAIKLGVLGFEPDIGRRLEATRQLITEGRQFADVGLSFSDGFGVHRRFGASMETRVMPPRGERTEREAQARIDEETGAFILSFDLGALLGLSKEKRREWLMSTLPRAAVDLDNDIWRRWLGYTDADEFIQRAIDHLWQHQVVKNQSLLDGLASALEYTREQFNAAEQKRQSQVDVSEAADRAAIQASAAVAPDADRLGAVQEELSSLERRRGELREQLAGVERAQEAFRRQHHDRRVREMRIADAERDLAAAKDRADTFDPFADRKKEQPRVDGLEAVLANEAEVAREVEATADAVERADRKVTGQRETIAYHEANVLRIQADMDRAEATLAALRDGECPTCGGTDVKKTLAEAEDALETMQPLLQKELADMESATAKLEEFVEVHSRAVDAYDAAHLRRMHIHDARQQLQSILRRLAETEAAAAVREENLSADVTRRTAELEQLRSDLKDLQPPAAPPVSEPIEAELAEVDARVSKLRDEQLELQARERAAGKAEALREQADKERRELERRTKKALSLRDLRDAQQRLRAHVIQQLVGPVEETAQAVLQEIDDQKTFRFIFEREGKDTFDFGFEEAGVFRSYDAASTGEDAFLAVVLVAALIAACAPAWRVLIVDNVEAIDDLRRRWLMVALGRIADRLDNIILAGCCDFAEIEGWQVVDVERLTAGTAEAAA